MVRLLLALALALLVFVPPVEARRAVTFLAAGANGDGSAFTIDTTGADVLVLYVGTASPGVISFTDGQSNTWTNFVDSSDNNARVIGHYVFSPSTSATHSFDSSTPGSSVCVMAFDGVTAYDDNEDIAQDTDANVTTASVTPDTSYSVMVSGFATNNNTNVQDASVDSPFTKVANEEAQAASNVGCAAAYYINASGSATAVTWSQPGSSDITGTLASFTGISSSTTPVPQMLSWARPLKELSMR